MPKLEIEQLRFFPKKVELYYKLYQKYSDPYHSKVDLNRPINFLPNNAIEKFKEIYKEKTKEDLDGILMDKILLTSKKCLLVVAFGFKKQKKGNKFGFIGAFKKQLK